jgi:hypothetical protein
MKINVKSMFFVQAFFLFVSPFFHLILFNLLINRILQNVIGSFNINLTTKNCVEIILYLVIILCTI